VSLFRAAPFSQFVLANYPRNSTPNNRSLGAWTALPQQRPVASLFYKREGKSFADQLRHPCVIVRPKSPACRTLAAILSSKSTSLRLTSAIKDTFASDLLLKDGRALRTNSAAPHTHRPALLVTSPLAPMRARPSVMPARLRSGGAPQPLKLIGAERRQIRHGKFTLQ
jgi:hypothetical protein